MSFRTYPRYSQPAIEWVESLPVHWPERRFKHFLDVLPSNVDKHSKGSETQVLLCNYTDVYYNDRITRDLTFMKATASSSQLSQFSLREGDIIITKDSEDPHDIAVPALVPESIPGVVCGYHLSILRIRDTACSRFIYFLLGSDFLHAYYFVSAKGLTRVGLSQFAIANTRVPLPPFDEQRTIAKFLDHETARIDALVAEQRRLIELLKEKRQAVISHAVTKGLDPNVPMKDSGVEWLGEVPTHWTVLKLGYLAEERCDGPFGSALKSEHYADAGVRVIRLQNIKLGGFDGADAAYISEEYYGAYINKSDVKEGDLLIAGLGDERNLVGRACVAPVGIAPAMVKADCFRFRLLTRLYDARFVARQLCSGANCDAGHLATGSTRQRIPLSAMSSRMIAAPPLAEQKKITEHVELICSQYDSLIRSSGASIELLLERRSALISAAVTGKIDVRNWRPAEDVADRANPLPMAAEDRAEYGSR